MTSAGLHGLFEIQSSSPIASPPVTHQKKSAPVRQTPASIELNDFTLDRGQTSTGNPSGTQTPKTPKETEQNQSPDVAQHEPAQIMHTWNDHPITKWRILCCCLLCFANGIHDASVGALIPYLETYYHIGYAVVSMLFVGNAAGFILSAFFVNMTLGKIGRAKTLLLSEAVIISGYIMLVTAPPYPVVVIGFFLLGYGFGTVLALNNVFCANLSPSSVILGLTHGSYGIGGILGPIMGTAMVSNGILWSRFYLIILGLRIAGIGLIVSSFWNYEEEPVHPLLTPLEQTASRQAAAEEEAKKKSRNLGQALKNRVTIFGALFIFAYQGAEVAISGWFISFLIAYRGGDPARVGYVTAGFWGGITLGRFVLTHLAPRIGEKTFVVGLTIGSALFQLLAWLVPNVITNAIAVCVLGFLLGPVYPCAQSIFARLMPRHLQTTAVGFMGGAGSSGGAVAPFTTGFLAQASGTWVLHPVCIGMYVVMMACWIGLPRVRKRTE
ncbi:MFS general substrate transporter [Periconia macrospinosa]|uniref:MFS general substrate transporter n=1 Tax=Periconia macrospinosa TaxID=97972 RepID=A0A2V1DZJ8_9PLEO|nr:MFS general substrate transporter [Periconia macrospinosa]